MRSAPEPATRFRIPVAGRPLAFDKQSRPLLAGTRFYCLCYWWPQHQGRQCGMPPSPLHVLTFATGSYLRWLVLLRANLRLLALPATELSVCTGDEASRRATSAMGVEVLDFSRSVTGPRNESASPPRQVAERFGTVSYVSVVHAKTRCIISKLSQLAQHADARVDVLLFFLDGDVTLFGDPRPHFAAMGVELALMSDRQGFGGACGLPPRNASATRMVFNSGFFLLRVGPAALWLWSTVQDYTTATTPAGDAASCAQRRARRQEILAGRPG